MRSMTRLGLSLTVTQQPTRSCAGAFSVLERDLTVDDDLLVPLGPLDAAPFAARQVVRDIADPTRVDVQLLHVVHEDVGGGAFAEGAAVAEPRGVGRQRRQPVV